MRHLLAFESDGLSRAIHAATSDTLNAITNIAHLKGLLPLAAKECSSGGSDNSNAALTIDITSDPSCLWPLASSYKIGVMGENGSPVFKTMWCIKDAVGSLMAHQEDCPNFESALFFNYSDGQPYTLIWPIRDLSQPNTVVTRNYLKGLSDKEKNVFKLVYFPEIYTKDDAFLSIFENMHRPQSVDAISTTSLAVSLMAAPPPLLPRDTTLKVFTTELFLPLFQKSLDNSNFVLTSSLQEAHIVWLGSTWTDWQGLNKRSQFINQFRGENVLTVKDLLMQAIYRFHGYSGPVQEWYPQTFNLNTETELFVGEFCRRRRSSSPSSNTWIVKPWNGTRSEGISISNNLSEIILQLSTGPKIAANYIHPPALLSGCKFDMRVIVILDSVYPEIKLYAFQDAIYPRVANMSYNNEGGRTVSDSFEKHFTVMKYKNYAVKKVSSEAMIKEITEASGKSWPLHLEKIYAVIRGAITAAVSRPMTSSSDQQQHCIQHSPLSKAIYGADILMDSSFNPWLLEFSMIPDTGRVLDQCPTFYADVFQFLFVQGGKSDKRLLQMFVEI